MKSRHSYTIGRITGNLELLAFHIRQRLSDRMRSNDSKSMTLLAEPQGKVMIGRSTDARIIEMLVAHPRWLVGVYFREASLQQIVEDLRQRAQQIGKRMYAPTPEPEPRSLRLESRVSIDLQYALQQTDVTLCELSDLAFTRGISLHMQLIPKVSE